jgi:hypothetical protein
MPFFPTCEEGLILSDTFFLLTLLISEGQMQGKHVFVTH